MWPFSGKGIRTGVTDAHREASIETRRELANLRATETRIARERAELKWELERREFLARMQDLDGDDDDDPDGINGMLMSLLAGSGIQIPGLQADAGTTTGTTTPAASRATLTDEEIMNIVDTFDKKQIKMASRMPESVLLRQIPNYLPGYDEDTYRRAVALLKDRK